MNSSTGVDHSVALGAEQKSIWCYSGIDLFVSLQIDSTEATRVNSLSSWASSDAPRPGWPAELYPHASVTPSAGPAKEPPLIARAFYNEERKQLDMSREVSDARSRLVGDPSSITFARREWDVLDGESRVLPQIETKGKQIRGEGKLSAGVEARRPRPGVAVRRFIARFGSPLLGPSYEPPSLTYSAQTLGEQEWNEQPEERFSEDDHEKVRDPDGLCWQCKSTFPSRGNVGTGCRCLAVSDNLVELTSVSQKDLGIQPKDQSRMDEEFFSCNENRSWSPQIEDYPWVPVDMNRHLDNRLTGCSEDSIDTGEDFEHDYPNMPSSLVSENDVVGRISQLEHNLDPSLHKLSPSTFPDIESFDVAEILAACQLVKMSCYDLSEQDLSATKGYDVNNLGFRDESNEGRLSKMVETMYATMPDFDVSNTRNALQLGVGKMELSPWSDEDRYIPRIARRARGRLSGAQFSTRIDFRDTETDEDRNCETLQRPSRKRQYKSTHEILVA